MASDNETARTVALPLGPRGGKIKLTVEDALLLLLRRIDELARERRELAESYV